MRLILPISFLVFSFGKITAQITVHGSVTDAAGKPIAGAGVFVKGTSFQVQTDVGGQFRIYIPEGGKAWVVKAGGRKQEFFLTKQAPVVLVMPPKKVKGQLLPFANRTVEGIVLDEATGSPLAAAIVQASGTKFQVVTGEDGRFQIFLPLATQGFIVKYGQRKAHFSLSQESFFTLRLPSETPLETADSLWLQTQMRKTVAVAEVGSENFNRGHLTDPVQLVQGKIAGLGIARAGDNPNEPYAIRLRGIHSLSQNAAPLFVVDGFPESALQAIEPLDVAKIRVLKDAAAAVKYGIRGSAGVVEIETRQLDGKDLRIDYQAYTGLENVREFLPVADRGTFLQLGGTDEGGGWTEWLDEITRSGRQFAQLVRIRGGKADTRFRFSLGYRQVEGTLLETGFHNLNLRGQAAQSFFKNKLQVSALLGANFRPAEPGFPQAWAYATEYNPTAPIGGTDAFALAHGGFFTRFISKNPVALLTQNTRRSKASIYTGKANARWQLPLGLFASARLARQMELGNTTTFYNEDGTARSEFSNGYADQFRLDRTNDFWSASLGQRASFGKLNLDWEAGYFYQQIRSDWVFNDIAGFSNRNFSFEPLENLRLEAGSEFLGREKTGDLHVLPAWFASAGVGFGAWLFLDASVRREGSSRLGERQKKGWFYGASAGMNVNKWLKLKGLEYLKPRFGFGRTGGVPAEPFLSRRLVKTAPPFIFFNGEEVPAVKIVGWENPDLKWETKRETNFGLDFSTAGGGLHGSLDFFRSTASDLIRRRDLASNYDFEPIHFYIWENSAVIKSQGMELSLGAAILRRKNFTWNLDFQLATAHATLEKLSNFETGQAIYPNLNYQNSFADGVNFLQKGKPIGQLLGGLIVNGNPGQLRDLNGDGNHCGCFADWTVVGNGLPEKLLGIHSQLQYKSLDFSFLLRGAYGHDLVNTSRLAYETAGAFWKNVLLTQGFDSNRTGSNYLSDFYVENASFTQLQYATLGYRFPLAGSRLVKSLRLAVTGQNLFVLTKYQGVDPEVRYELPVQQMDFLFPQPIGQRAKARPNIQAFGLDAISSWMPGRIWSLQVQASF